MQHFQQPGMGGTFATNVRAAESERAFMTGVFGWMATALTVTAAVGYFVAMSPQIQQVVLSWFLPLVLIELGVAFVLGMFASRMSGIAAAALFMGYAALSGLTFSVFFLVYELGSMASVFVLTAGMFAAMAFYGMTTKKDLSSWGTFLFMGLIGVVLAGIVNIFMQNSMLQFVISCVAVVVFTGLAAYDVRKLRELHAQADGTAVSSLSITGAFILYLDFINLFIALLRLFGRRR